MDKETIKEYAKCTFWAIVVFCCIVGVTFLLTGCRSKEYIPIEHNHTEHHWHTDSVKQVDSIYREKETTIMQLDSGAMAKYGIQLKTAEHAWLVQSRELERQIEQLQRLVAERDTVHDSIPVPYPVEKRLTKWQQAKLDYGEWFLVIIFIFLMFCIFRPRRVT